LAISKTVAEEITDSLKNGYRNLKQKKYQIGGANKMSENKA
jgi:hypothetical protein